MTKDNFSTTTYHYYCSKCGQSLTGNCGCTFTKVSEKRRETFVKKLRIAVVEGPVRIEEYDGYESLVEPNDDECL